MPVAGLLLTGGSSQRMGIDKAALPAWNGESLAERTARLLAGTTACALEVGPGWSNLPRVPDMVAGAGPLAAMASGIAALFERGWEDPVIVVATDLPCLNAGMLGWLAHHPARSSVVPLLEGRPQPLCARYSSADCAAAAKLAAGGYHSMTRLLDQIDALMAGPDLWITGTGDPHVLDDADTPERLAQLLALPAPRSGRP